MNVKNSLLEFIPPKMNRSPYDQLWLSSPATQRLARSSLFKPSGLSVNLEEQTRLTYRRAKAFCAVYALTVDDIVNITPKFVKMNIDPLATMDGSAFALIAIQYNLFVGTVAPFSLSRPELRPVIQQAMNFEVSAQFMLTEIGHGLDARNLQTKCTLLPNGDFDLHTPSSSAAKAMPPTTPRCGLPVTAVVIARLIVGSEDRGVKPFMVALGNGKEMCNGVTCKVLPQRTGAHPLDHAITSFNHVRLPGSSLLGSPEKPINDRDHFKSMIHRVAVGTLLVASPCIPALQVSTFNASQFSFRREVTGYGGKQIPVIEFRTQQLPILHAIAQCNVLKACLVHSAEAFTNGDIDIRVRHAIAAAFKAVAAQHCLKSLRLMNEGCGWHGYFEHNQILQLELEGRSAMTAEGDIRVLAIRLAAELLLGRYEMPPPKDPTTPIARHEAALLAEGRSQLMEIGHQHRTEEFNRHILPLSLPLIESVGHRLAYEAAKDSNVDPKIIALYESGVIKEDSAWYAEQGGISRQVQRVMETEAADALLPLLPKLIQEPQVQAYSTAPMVSHGAWNEFLSDLQTFSGTASFDVWTAKEVARL